MSEGKAALWPVPPMVSAFRRAFDTEHERRQRALAALVGQGTRDNVLLVMMANRGYNDLFNNWVSSCDDNGLNVRSWSLLFAADEEAAANADNQGFRTYFDGLSYGDQPRDAAKVFGDGDFRKLMFQKTAVVEDVLELGYDVLFQDVDMVWRKDPLDYLLATESTPFDTRFMYDGDNPIHGPLFANTGFFLLRNRPITRDLWTRVFDSYAEMVRRGSQQSVVNTILGKHEVRVDILPEEQFANGHLFSIDKPSRLPCDPYVIHCSWTSNLEHKIRKYRMAGLWYL
jgi:hypothetical protein